MRTLIWVIVAYLVTIISLGAIFYQPQPSPQVADRGVLIELALNDRVERVLQRSTGVPEEGLIILSTPNLRGVKILDTIQGVSIRVLTRDEIDALSRISPVNYMFFERIVKSDPYTAEVELTFTHNYQVDAKTPIIGQNSGITYTCSKQSGEWVISSAGAWVP